MIRKIKKRFLALLLSCAIITGVTSTSVRDAYATSAGIIIGGGGAVVGAETAFAYLLGIMGITAASAAVYENRDALIDWGSTQLGKFKTWAGEKKDALGAWAGSTVEEINRNISSWAGKLSAGTLDKSDTSWAAVKEWLAADAYTSSGGAVYNDLPWYSKNVTFSVGVQDWRVSFPDGVVKGFGQYTFYQSSQRRCIVEFVFSDLPVYLECLENGSVADYWNFSSDNLPSNSVTYNGNIYYTFESNRKGDISIASNYLGAGVSGSASVREKAVQAFVDGVSGVIGGTGDYAHAGGISNVLGGAGTLDNVDVVGTGSKAGDTDVVISWPRDYAFDQVLGGVASGDKTWADAIGSLGVGVVDKTAEGDRVIGNDGVTDKTWTYAGATTPDITIPGTGEVEASKELKDYTLAGLEKVFPFCLPFDLIDFIKVLEAPAQAPHFVLPLKYPALDGMATYEIDVDLSRFDDVASLLRDMECLLFIVGLIMITRSRMIRG